MREELRDIVSIAHQRMRTNLTDAVFTLIQSDNELSA